MLTTAAAKIILMTVVNLDKYSGNKEIADCHITTRVIAAIAISMVLVVLNTSDFSPNAFAQQSGSATSGAATGGAATAGGVTISGTCNQCTITNAPQATGGAAASGAAISGAASGPEAIGISTLVDAGNALYHQDNYTEAIQYYDKALAMHPNDEFALKNKQIALSNMGQ